MDPQETDDRSGADSTPSDTVREHLANERTMLAWSRTGVAVIALGFVVARFGLLIRELTPTGISQIPRGVSTVFGVVLVICGIALIGLATLRYVRVARAINRHAYQWSPVLGLLLNSLLGLVGLALAVYLLMTGS